MHSRDTALHEISIAGYSTVRPQITGNLLSIAVWIVVILAAGVVTLTNRTQVTATVDAAHHMTAVHVDISIAIDLTGSPAGYLGIILLVVSDSLAILFFGAFCYLFKSTVICALTFTAAINAVTYISTVNVDRSTFIDMAILTAAIDRSCNTTQTCFQSQCVLGINLSVILFIQFIPLENTNLVSTRCRQINVNLGFPNVGYGSLCITFTGRTLTASIHITVILLGIFNQFNIGRISIVIKSPVILDRLVQVIPLTHVVLTRQTYTTAVNVNCSLTGVGSIN